ncbi:group II intron reverse transcriptase/maturase [Bacillus sp. AGMB 02131]|uniref:Group II intron reverse transcriptase/maturase n=1 Tax=Peribacillus faecalis TaxID=2772559 RepID=A0A927CWK2_9BACI|nr:reverse transcriptase domain-containing protein [Peribacillus faecalis]MBD3108886.1 group II intron reverse transcriptase/maturase [Peribacillus faecalis]
MQSSKIVIDNLSKHANKENYKYNRLYRHMYNEEFYIKAYAKLSRNRGSSTKGVDNETADGFSIETVQRLIASLKDESYQPNPVRRTHIPKKNSDKKRPIGIPSFSDKLVQEVCRTILEAIYEPNFSDNSHGFRLERSCHSALNKVQNSFTGSKWFIEGDIKGFFDNINHNKMIEILRRRITDEKFIRLIWKFLRAGYLEDWKFHNSYSGTPQGGIISPILANIYLNEFDNFVERTLKEEFDKGDRMKGRKVHPKYRLWNERIIHLNKKMKSMSNRSDIKEALKLKEMYRKERSRFPRWDNRDTSYKKIDYVRYADDFLVAVYGSKEDCVALKKKMKDFLAEELQLELSEEKTLITHTTKEAKFLGYSISIYHSNQVKKDKNGIPKKTLNGRIRLRIPEGSLQKWVSEKGLVKDMNAKSWRMMHRKELLQNSDLEIISQVNAEIRGLYNYFCMAENVSTVMNMYYHAQEYSCLKTFANKYRTTVVEIRKRFRIGDNWGIKYYGKDGKEKYQEFYNKGFKRIKQGKAGKSLDNKVVNFYATRTQLEDRIRANSCELCGISGDEHEYEVHHVNKVKNLKGKENWEKVMIAKRRKTLVVCKHCHRKIHNGVFDGQKIK